MVGALGRAGHGPLPAASPSVHAIALKRLGASQLRRAADLPFRQTRHDALDPDRRHNRQAHGCGGSPGEELIRSPAGDAACKKHKQPATALAGACPEPQLPVAGPASARAASSGGNRASLFPASGKIDAAPVPTTACRCRAQRWRQTGEAASHLPVLVPVLGGVLQIALAWNTLAQRRGFARARLAAAVYGCRQRRAKA